MQVKIDKVTDVKTDQRGTSCKIHQGNDYWFVNEDATPLVGKQAEIEVTEKTSAKGNKYRIAKIVKVIETQASAAANGNGHISWSDYSKMAALAHDLAKDLEPDSVLTNDETTVVTVDRSVARIAFVNTVGIAFSNNKISLPEESEESPF